MKGGHTKNARPSSRETHENGNARRKRDQERSKRLNKGKKRSFPMPIDDDGYDDNICDSND